MTRHTRQDTRLRPQPFTPQQIEVLRMLAVAPRRTSKLTANGAIAGRTAACLMRLELVEPFGPSLVRITDAGLLALEASGG
jgi:hypothetical protein